MQLVTTQLYRKHNGVLALLYVTLMLIWLHVVLRENFKILSWPCCVVIFCETFMTTALSVGVIFRENCLWLKLKIFIVFVEFFSPICWQTCCSPAVKKSFLKFVCQSKEWSTKRICKEFSVKKSAVSSVEDRCKMQKTNAIERKTGAERRQTARSEQNYRHMTELICSQEGNTESSGSPTEMINLTVISLSSGCCEKLWLTQTRHC